MNYINFYENMNNQTSVNPFFDEREAGMSSMECVTQEKVIPNVRLAHAYVPMQNMCSIFTPMVGLHKGTIFPELFSPYPRVEAKKCKKDKKHNTDMNMEEM